MLMIFAMFAALAALVHPATTSVSQTLRAKDRALLDAITNGDRSLWDRNLTADAVYVDENGAILHRAEFLKALTPLPHGTSGRLAMTDFNASVTGDVALVIHRDDEFENYHGQRLRTQYLTTETWLERAGEWRLALAHVYVVAKDPPAVTLAPSALDAYAGRYRAGPDLEYTMGRDGNRLAGGTAGMKVHPILAEAPDVLFVPGRPRLRFLFKRDVAGSVTGFVERQEGEDVVWTREPAR